MNHFLHHLSRVEAFATDSSIHQQAEDFVIKDNPLPVMFSAPHAVAQVRDGVEKFAEPGTGAMVLMLAEGGFPVIIKTRNDANDANWDEQSSYRDALIEYIVEEKVAVLFDLHQLAPDREHDAIIGTAHGKNIFGRDDITKEIIAQLELVGLENIAVDEIFTASKPTTVSAHVAREAQIPCFQIEFNSQFFLEQAPRADAIVGALKKVALYAVTEEAHRSQNG